MTSVSAYADVQITIKKGATLPRSCDESPCIQPDQITIQKGDKVTWMNLDNLTHRIESGNPTTGPDAYFDTGFLAPGKNFTQFFYKYGTYEYFEPQYPWLEGTIKVAGNSHPIITWDFYMLMSDPHGPTTTPFVGMPLTITKYVNDTGNGSATGVSFELEIYNEKKVLVEKQFVTADVNTNKSTEVTFKWLPNSPGLYDLVFTADARNILTLTNESNTVEIRPVMVNQYADNNYQVVPEFGMLDVVVLSLAVGFGVLTSMTRLKRN